MSLLLISRLTGMAFPAAVAHGNARSEPHGHDASPSAELASGRGFQAGAPLQPEEGDGPTSSKRHWSPGLRTAA